MEKIKNFFAELPQRLERGEKGAILFTCGAALCVAICLFAAVVFLPKLFSKQAVTAGGEATSEITTMDEDWRYDYTLLDAPPEETASEPETESESETQEETKELPSVAIAKPVVNDPESIQRPKDDPGPQITVPVNPGPPPEIDSGSQGNGDTDISGGDTVYNYFAIQALNGFQILDGVKYYFDHGNPFPAGFHTLNGLRYRINSYGAVSSKVGIDISEFNGTVNWAVAKNAGVDFAIIRCAYRGYGSAGDIKEDIMLDTNIRAAKAAGVPVGLYFFSQAVNAQEGREEAIATIEFARKYDVELPLYIDTEASTDPDGDGRADHISNAARTAAVKAFCDTVRSYGYTPGIYASASWFTERLDFSQLQGYDIWVAHYTTANQPSFRYTWKTWQYSSKLVIPGLQTGNDTVDANISLYDYTKHSDMSDLGKNFILLDTQAEVDVYVDAENWVARAQESRTAEDVETARSKVNALFDPRVKNTLLARLDQIEVIVPTEPNPPSTSMVEDANVTG